MTAQQANYHRAADIFPGWRDDVVCGKPPTLYPCGTGDLSRIEIGPGLVSLFGGAPGTGKTTLTMQLLVAAMRLSPSLRVLVANIETAPPTLLERQLARLSGVSATDIRYRKLKGSHADRLDQAFCTLESLADRLAFLRPPFDLGNVALAADEFHAHIILLDYIQRIPPPGDHGDRRGTIDATMSFLREFAGAGVAVVVVAAVSRTKDKRGRTSYAGDGLNLASFRESSELEFGADDAFMLIPDDESDGRGVVLAHLKARHTEPKDIALTFDRSHQRFDPRGDNWDHAKETTRVAASALRELWKRTPVASNGE